jgi:hypothetical protein
MITKNGIVFSIECKRSIEYCFCCCSYCGKMIEYCFCNLEDSNKKDKVLSTKQKSKLRLLKQSMKSPLINTKDDEWWCLEKWQIGRKNFS